MKMRSMGLQNPIILKSVARNGLVRESLCIAVIIRKRKIQRELAQIYNTLIINGVYPGSPGKGNPYLKITTE